MFLSTAHLVLTIATVLASPYAVAADGQSEPIRVLFLGDNGHHQPKQRFEQIRPVLARRGIQLTYTDQAADLNPARLGPFDGLLVYANTTRISPEQEQALLDFVANGKGFIPIHCASYCFLNSDKYIELVGAQFLRHGAGVFRTTIAVPDHPIMQGLAAFENWDETYVHTRHSESGRTVLEYREDSAGKEPWTWVRSHGRGRVFYTAWGHDHRTWGNPGFHTLLERGIRWAVGRDPSAGPPSSLAASDSPFDAPFAIPEMTPRAADAPAFDYVDVGKKIPNYMPSRQWGVQGEPLSKMQLPLPPHESMRHIEVPRGFRVELFASDPDLGGKPLAMNWDERGRLWVAETYDYPNELQPPGHGRDRIRICEDSDGDGRADMFTVFAENLSIPTSLTFSYGGVIVFDGTQTLFLKDSDGDDRADVRQVLFGSWNQRDTHGGPSNMQYGLDNWFWAMQGYNPSRLEVAGETVQFAQGFFRFRVEPGSAATPKAAKLEFVRSTNNNTWGLGISEEGLVFGSTANRNPSVFMPIPNRYYESVRGWAPSLVLSSIADSHLFHAVTDRVRQVDQHGGYTAAAGHALYTARRYPKPYWNRVAFVTEPTGHLVGGFVLRRERSDFRSNNSFNLLASHDEWCAPIMAEVGPDGNVWVIDWYNYIVQHNPTPTGFQTGKGAAYETELRDKKHGRIYRVVYAGEPDAEPAPPPRRSLAGADARQLVEALPDDNLFWRRHAQRLLVERGQADVLPALLKLAADPGSDAIGLNPGAIHALWTMHGLGLLDGSNPDATRAAVQALRHRSPGVRRNAVQVLPRNARSVDDILAAGLLADADPQVRLSTLLALADQPATAAGAAAVAAAARDPLLADDRWLGDAATAAAAHHAEHFLQSIAGSTTNATAAFASITATVAEHYARGKPSTESLARVLAALAKADAQSADGAIRGLAKGWIPKHPVRMTEPLETELDRLAQRLEPDRRGVLVQLAATWGSRKFEKFAIEVSRSLLARTRNEQLPADERVQAARELVAFRSADAAVLPELVELITPRTAPDLAAGLLQAVAGHESPDAAALVLEQLKGLTPSVRSAALAVLLTRPEWTGQLLDAAEKARVNLAELSLDQRDLLTRHPDRRIANRARTLLARGGSLPDPDRQKVLETLMPLTQRSGDVAAGKAVFQKQCAKCHTHSGEGNKVGPDLSGMAVHPKDELLTQIIDPSRSVEANYRAYAVALKDGRVLSGLLASESRTSIELFDTEGKPHSVLREDIDELLATTKSLMPEGFEKQITPDEIVHLLEFLAARGRFLPIPLDKVATAVSTRGMFVRRDAVAERLVFDNWSPKQVGDVPFVLVDPQGERISNVLMLHGPQGAFAPAMPRSARLTCNSPAKSIHLLSGISGWGHPIGEIGSVTLIVRLHYADGSTEDHPLLNGVHFADYIRRVDVPQSEFAFNLRGRQVRYLAVTPKRGEVIKEIEFVKGDDASAPVVVAVTIESP